jgi:hypothetical protein
MVDVTRASNEALVLLLRGYDLRRVKVKRGLSTVPLAAPRFGERDV